MKNFFSITDDHYVFEITDLCALITILNVAFILTGFWWAPILGLINCVISIVVNIRIKAHINLYLIQCALIVLNIYFLTL